jgi:hypothetical protein
MAANGGDLESMAVCVGSGIRNVTLIRDRLAFFSLRVWNRVISYITNYDLKPGFMSKQIYLFFIFLTQLCVSNPLIRSSSDICI